jgi:hypothetical protein
MHIGHILKEQMRRNIVPPLFLPLPDQGKFLEPPRYPPCELPLQSLDCNAKGSNIIDFRSAGTSYVPQQREPAGNTENNAPPLVGKDDNPRNGC